MRQPWIDGTSVAAGLAITSLLAFGCASNNVQVHHAADAKLESAAYASYRVVDQTIGSRTADVGVANAIHEAMQAQGLQRADDDSAELLVTFKLLAVDGDRPTASQNIGSAIASALTYGEAFMPADATGKKLVLIQLQDAKSMQVVWIGWAQADMKRKQLASRATETATKILKRMPRGFGPAPM